MGYGNGKESIARWREAECKVLTEIACGTIYRSLHPKSPVAA